MIDFAAALLAAADQFDVAVRPIPWQTPGALAQHLNPKTRQTPALDLIDAELVRALETPDARVIITVPPQEGKSERAGKVFPLFALLRNPDLRIVTASYGQNLANRTGRSVRNLLADHPELELEIARDHGSASEWSIAGREGGLVSVGRGAGVAGRAADLLIIDDPIKDRAEADSRLIRDATWDWWTDVLAARLSPGAPVVLITTRWHEDDLAGRLMKHDAAAGWRLLNIPAQCDDPESDPLGREYGEFMVSARGRSQEQWEQRKRTAGSRAWTALYQGRPSPGAGSLLRRDQWRYWTAVPPSVDMIVQSWDLAFKDTKTSDFVVGQVWAKDGADAYLLDQVRGRFSFSETCRQIETLKAKWPQSSAIYVEDKANGPAVIDALRRKVPGLVPVNPEGGKVARASAIQPFVEAGNVHLPPADTFPWVGELIEEAAAFPTGTHDDQVDALTQALTRLFITTVHQGGTVYGF